MSRILVIFLGIACLILLFFGISRVINIGLKILPSEAIALDYLGSQGNYYDGLILPSSECNYNETGLPITYFEGREKHLGRKSLDGKNMGCLMSQAEEIVNFSHDIGDHFSWNFLILGINRKQNNVTKTYNYVFDYITNIPEEEKTWLSEAQANLRKHQDIFNSITKENNCSPNGNYCVDFKYTVVIPRIGYGLGYIDDKGFTTLTLADSRGVVVGRKYFMGKDGYSGTIGIIDWGSDSNYFRVLTTCEYPPKLYKFFVP